MCAFFIRDKTLFTSVLMSTTLRMTVLLWVQLSAFYVYKFQTSLRYHRLHQRRGGWQLARVTGCIDGIPGDDGSRLRAGLQRRALIGPRR